MLHGPGTGSKHGSNGPRQCTRERRGRDDTGRLRVPDVATRVHGRVATSVDHHQAAQGHFEARLDCHHGGMAWSDHEDLDGGG